MQSKMYWKWGEGLWWTYLITWWFMDHVLITRSLETVALLSSAWKVSSIHSPFFHSFQKENSFHYFYVSPSPTTESQAQGVGFTQDFNQKILTQICLEPCLHLLDLFLSSGNKVVLIEISLFFLPLLFSWLWTSCSTTELYLLIWTLFLQRYCFENGKKENTTD